MIIVGQQIRKLRKQLNQTQQKFADQIDSNVKIISAYETKRAVPPLDALLRIANYCKVSLDYLAKGKEFSSGSSSTLQAKGPKAKGPKDSRLSALLKKAQKASPANQKKIIKLLSSL